MDKKGFAPTFALVVSLISFLGLLGCGVACFCLYREIKVQGNEVSQARAQIFLLDQALKNQQQDLSKAQEQLASATHKIAEVQEQSQSLRQQLTEMQSRPRESNAAAKILFPPMLLARPGPDVPAGDSVEGKLRAEGKTWERAAGQPVPGEYVQDILQGRSDQPRGRGNIGKVLSVAVDDKGTPSATVDFGRGCTVGIMCSELAPIHFVAPEMR